MLLRRFLGLSALAFVIAAVSHQSFADTIIRKDKKSEKGVTVTGKVSADDVGGVKVKLSPTKEEAVPANEIISVSYSGFPIPVNNKLAEAQEAEAKRDYATTLAIYESLLSGKEPKDKFTMPPEAKRNFEFRVASLKAALADGEEQMKAAIKGLSDFLTANPDCWQFSHGARQLARLQTDVGDYPAATALLEKLEKAPAVPVEFKADAAAALIDLAFQSDDTAAGTRRVEAALKDPKATPAMKERLAMYQLALDGVNPLFVRSRAGARGRCACGSLSEHAAEKTHSSSFIVVHRPPNDCGSAAGAKRNQRPRRPPINIGARPRLVKSGLQAPVRLQAPC